MGKIISIEVEETDWDYYLKTGIIVSRLAKSLKKYKEAEELYREAYDEGFQAAKDDCGYAPRY